MSARQRTTQGTEVPEGQLQASSRAQSNMGVGQTRRGLAGAERGVPGAEGSREGKSHNQGRARVWGRGQKRLGGDGL